ncbi:MAG: glycosyltransferase family 2 protein [Dehalococcoidia bacterium]
MDVSIVIVSYNGRDFLRRCLSSVHHHTRGIEFEVIVVDNASADGTPEMVAEEFPQVTLIRRGSNAGFAVAVNQGAAIAKGSTVFVLNPDAELLDDALSRMLGYLNQHSDIGVLAPKLLDGDGSLQLSCRAFPNYAVALFNRYSLLTRILPKNRLSARYLMTAFDHSAIADVDWISAACWLIPRRTIELVGLLDEGYFWSIEDVDYCQRVHRSGLRVVYFPEVAVRHHIGVSSATLPNRAIIARHRGMWRYYRSYLRPGSPLAKPMMDVLVRGGVWLRCGLQLLSHNVRRLLSGN